MHIYMASLHIYIYIHTHTHDADDELWCRSHIISHGYLA